MSDKKLQEEKENPVNASVEEVSSPEKVTDESSEDAETGEEDPGETSENNESEANSDSSQKEVSEGDAVEVIEEATPEETKVEVEEAETASEPAEPVEAEAPTAETEEAAPEETEAVVEEVETTSESAESIEAEAPAAETEEAEASEEDAQEVSSEDKEEEISSSEEDEEASEAEEEVEVDYSSLSKEALVEELRKLLKDKPVQDIKHAVEEIRTEFASKFAEEVEQKKQEFLAEGGNVIDFHHTTPLRKEFNSLYFDYKEKRSNYYKGLKKDLQENLAKRLELIEELKGLLNAEENINTTYKHFKDIQDRWHVAGAIPRDKYNIVWNTYRHHVENFYDFLHLNREFRDLDFKHNLEQKVKLIGRAEELAQEENVSKAFRELQMLHKMWKEDIGPVAKEFRDEVWEKFSAATKVIHDKRQDYIKEQEKSYEGNLEAKQELIEEIKSVVASTQSTHQGWQSAIKKVQELRDKYFEIGKVPRANNKEIWNAFKEATREFNKQKNSFYKSQKKEQYVNLEKKRELIKIAIENKDSDDFEAVTPLMKKIQSDWKRIGHVPRKESDKIWKEFKDACNQYFDRLHAQKDEANKEQIAHLEEKQKLLESLSSLELSGTHEANLQTIKDKISEWKAIGRVPYNKRNIERDFNKALDGLFGQLDLSKKEAELIRFENKINSMISQEDDRKLQNERFFISKKIEEAKNEIRQLENNLGFFQHADDDNPLVKEVRENISRHKEQLEVWKAKLSKIKSMK